MKAYHLYLFALFNSSTKELLTLCGFTVDEKADKFEKKATLTSQCNTEMEEKPINLPDQQQPQLPLLSKTLIQLLIVLNHNSWRFLINSVLNL